MPASPLELSVRLRVICLAPPDPHRHHASFGLQEKSPGAWILHEGRQTPEGDHIFECECRVRSDTQGGIDFFGPFIHGKRGERFLYVSWKPKGWKPGQSELPAPIWPRRIKVHLRSITPAQAEKAANTVSWLCATITGTARDGGPACASVPLLGKGWKVVSG